MKPSLEEFLKCKKVKCVKAHYNSLTVGKEYSVLNIRIGVEVIDNAGSKYYWRANHFEPVIDELSNSAENPPQDVELTPETEASEPKFKVGDKVYFGTDPDIKTISEVGNDNDVQFAGEFGWASGYSCCHANQENCERLQATFTDIEFERPPKPLSGDELVRAMLTKGIKNVLCLWGSGDKIIIDRLDYKGSLMSTNCHIVGGLTPIDWYTGEPLTEVVLDE